MPLLFVLLQKGGELFTMEFNSYEPVPDNIAQEIVEGKSIRLTILIEMLYNAEWTLKN